MLTFLKFCLFFHFAFLSEARETQLDPDSSVRFDYFVEHRFHYLEVPNKTESKVSEFVDCAMECLKSSKCLSLNMAAASDNEKILLCELLFADMFSNPQGLRENATSHHFSKWSPCVRRPCQNGGSCIANYDHYSYRCICATGFSGKNCSLKCNVTDGWQEFNNHCYKYIPTKKTWSDAKTLCESLGSYLVTVHSQKENDFVRSLFSAAGGIWLGANDMANEGSWIWEDGETWGGYTAWDTGEPGGGNTEQCLGFDLAPYANSGKWHDAPCAPFLTNVMCKKRILI